MQSMVYEDQLMRLYSAQRRIEEDPYLHAHSRNRAVIRRQISIFQRCQVYFETGRTVLDWGCRHAPDACLIRMLRGDEVELYGCDVEEKEYRAFYDFARLKYSQITHPYLLPYDDSFFDAVIGGGVLEHVPDDSQSLRELYRIIKVGGYFVMTMLPNRLSYTECLNRTLGHPHHLRLYGLRHAKRLFLQHGFLPVRSGYHQIFPSLSSLSGGIFDLEVANRLVETMSSFNRVGEQTPLLRAFATNIFIVGKKVDAFHG